MTIFGITLTIFGMKWSWRKVVKNIKETIEHFKKHKDTIEEVLWLVLIITSNITILYILLSEVLN